MGNADLKQSYTHQLSARFTRTNVDNNTSIANSINVRNTSDFITNATYTVANDSLISGEIILPRGGQISQPLNIDGYWNIDSAARSIVDSMIGN